MNKKVVLLIVILAGLAVAAVVLFRRANREPADRIAVSGNIELNEVNIAFKTAGRLVERAVDEGDAVKKGMVIARLDRDQLLRQRDREQAALQAALAQVAQARTSIQWQSENLRNDVDLRKADLQVSQSRLDELKSGSRPEEIREAKAAAESARIELDRAKKDWDRAQVLYKNDDISTSQYDQYRSRFESASSALKQIEERLKLVEAGPRKETIEGAEAQVQRSRASLKAGEANSLEVTRRQQELLARRAEIDRAKANIALIDSQLADTVVASPIDGVVLVKSADVGEILAPGTAIVTVGDIDHPWLRGYINERDLGKVKLGTKVKVTTDSYPGKVYWGRISFISSEAEFTPKQIQTKEERVKLVYRVKIELDNSSHELKSNMPADAEILLNQS